MRRTLLAAFLLLAPVGMARADQPPSGTVGTIENDTDMVHDDSTDKKAAAAAPAAAVAGSSATDDDNPETDDDSRANKTLAPRKRAVTNTSGRIIVDRSHGANPAAMAPEDYQGVRLDGKTLPPRAPKLPITRGPQRMTWSGFQIKGGVPTVFVQLTAAPDYTVADERGRVTVRLKNTTVPLRNNLRALDVGEFGTQVSTIVSKKAGNDTLVTISTRDAAAPSHRERVEPAAGGFQLLVIELPSATVASPQ